MNIGDKVTIRPTQGGYQTEQTRYVVKLTPKRVWVSQDPRDSVGWQEFCRTTGKPFGYFGRQFPCYWLVIPS